MIIENERQEAERYKTQIASLKQELESKQDVYKRQLLPSEDVYEIRHMQTQTRDALTRLFQKGNISFGSVKDVRGSLKRLEIGSSLGISELLAIAGLLENTNRVKAYSRNERGDAREDSLDGMFESLEPLTPLSAEIRRCKMCIRDSLCIVHGTDIAIPAHHFKILLIYDCNRKFCSVQICRDDFSRQYIRYTGDGFDFFNQ